MTRRTLTLAGLIAMAACARESATTAPAGPAPTPPATVMAAATPATRPRVAFDAQVLPILRTRCSPCHFEGGRMYEKLPFDDPGTIRSLGTKLFTRIKDESEQATIRAFLDQPS